MLSGCGGNPFRSNISMMHDDDDNGWKQPKE